MPLQIPTGANTQYYANGRGLARYQAQKPLATDPPAGTPLWWSNEGVKDVWAGIPSRIGAETIWLDVVGNERSVVGGPGAGTSPGANPPPAGPSQAPTYQRRQAPVYQPRAGQTGPSYYIPPTPGQPAVPVIGGAVAVTYEIYGRMNGRQVPLWKELSFDGASFHIKQGGRILISHSPAEGYGFGGMPGGWTRLYGSRSPSDWGLDPDKGVVAFDGSRAYAVPATQLVEIFGPTWRQVVYA